MSDIYFEFFSIEPSTLAGVLINTLILLKIFKKYLFKPVNAVLEQRSAAAADMLSSADAALREAQDSKERYERMLSDAQQSSDEIIMAASKKAGTISENVINEANAEAKRLILQAEEDIRSARRRASEDMRSQISDIAVMIAERLLERELSSDIEQQRLIDGFIDSLEVGGDAD